MTTVEQLQQTGLNKYEAEAYYTLLMRGALTGYEVGKYSQVPLSRSYEILERLVEKGLALVQPGEPPRYSAQEPEQFLAHVRSTMESTLNALTTSLSTLERPDRSGEFWVVRGRQNIVERACAMIAAARTSVELILPSAGVEEVNSVLEDAHRRGCSITRTTESSRLAEDLLLLCDGREAFIGALAPAETCQAIVSENHALRMLLQNYMVTRQSVESPVAVASGVSAPQAEGDWLDWEARKQRHLWSVSKPERVA